MPDAPHGARVPRAVAGVPPPALADGEAVAKAWLLELVAAAPLARVAAVEVAELAARGPALCAALLAAVGSAAELERLGPGGDRAALAADAGALAGAVDAVAGADAVAALRRALWAAVRAELRDLDAAATAALAERVAHVADVVTAAVLAFGSLRAPDARPDEPGGGAPSSLPDARAPDARRGEQGAGAPSSLPDARAPDARPGEPGAGAPSSLPDARAPDARRGDAPAREAPLEVDLAGAEEPWREAIDAALRAHGRHGAPFAVLAVEVADAERLLAAGGGDAAALVAFE